MLQHSLVLFVALVVLAVALPLAVLLPWRDLVRHRRADAVWLGGVAAGSGLLTVYTGSDPLALPLYPSLGTLIVMYLAAGFKPRAVLGLGGLVVLGYPMQALGDLTTSVTVVLGVTVALSAAVLLGALLAGNRIRLTGLRRRAERRAETLLEQSSDAIIAVDAGGVVRYQSPSAASVLGCRPGELAGVAIDTIVHPSDQPTATRWLADLVDAGAGATARTEVRLRRSDGGWIHTEVAAVNRLADPDLAAVVLDVRDVGTRKELEEQLARHAFGDSLTGLANRALFRDRVAHAVERGRRSASTVALLLLNVDAFKITNDSLGHVLGDQLLVAIAGRLRGYVRPSDTLARLGGDEFALLIEDRIDEIAAVTLGERLLEAVRAPIRLGGRDVAITASIGIAVIKAGVYGAVDADELLRDADLALYAAKSAGRDGCVLFDPSMHVEVLREAGQRADLELALAGDQFVVRYQPIVALPDIGLVGVEALVRWQHPQRGLLGPSEFIPLAESTGLIVPLGRWVLQQACAQVMRWQEAFPTARRLRMSVNLSPRQFQYSGLVDDVAGILHRTGITPHQVVLEITESLLMLDTDATVNTLHELKALGVRLAIDDFGTGYSSLSYLRRFPVDIIKIDRSFVGGMISDGGDAALTEAVVQIGRSMHLQTVAEGIETAEQSARLTALGCDFGQGFLFSRPAHAADIEAMLS